MLDRSAKSVELTPAGEVLFEFAERLLRLRDESMQVVADRGNVVQGPVVFGANEATCLYLLPDIFAEFQRRYPLVQISIYRNFSHKILQRLEDGSVDLGIVTLPLKSPNSEGASHLARPPALHGQQPAILSRTAAKSRSRKSPAAADLSQDRLHPPGAGQAVPALSRSPAHRDGTAQHRHDQAFCGADAGISIISEGFARDQVKTGEVKLLNVEGVDL